MKSRFLSFLVALALLLPAVAAAQGQLEVSTAEWTTQAGMVNFHIQIHNAGTGPSMPTLAEVSSQEYGAFLPPFGSLATFDVPPIEPDSFFDVVFEVPLGMLPPSPMKFQEWAKNGGVVQCGPDDHWDGNIDIFMGGLHFNVHNAHMYVCPGHGNSLIHVVTGCAAPMPWWFGAVCQGFHVALQNMDRTPAPNPVPPGWQGFIVGWADPWVPLGTVCCVALNFSCLGAVQPVWVCLEACDCSAIGIEPSTWGTIKSLYR